MKRADGIETKNWREHLFVLEDLPDLLAVTAKALISIDNKPDFSKLTLAFVQRLSYELLLFFLLAFEPIDIVCDFCLSLHSLCPLRKLYGRNGFLDGFFCEAASDYEPCY